MSRPHVCERDGCASTQRYYNRGGRHRRPWWWSAAWLLRSLWSRS